MGRRRWRISTGLRAGKAVRKRLFGGAGDLLGSPAFLFLNSSGRGGARGQQQRKEIVREQKWRWRAVTTQDMYSARKICTARKERLPFFFPSWLQETDSTGS